MRPIILLSTYKLSKEDQWDLCRMLERAHVSEFDFITLETRKTNLDDLIAELDAYAEEPIVVTLDDTAIEFAHKYLDGHCRIVDWYKPSLSYIPPKVIGQQLCDVLSREATQTDDEG